MAVSEEELTEIDRILTSGASTAMLELRSKFPHLTWTRCDASDVIETPYKTYPNCDVHLLDGGDHCVQITTEPSRATGVVLAFRKVA